MPVSINPPTPPSDWQAAFHTELKEAMNPVLLEMKELRTEMQNLRYSAANRADVYDTKVMDEKLNAIRLEISEAKDAIKQSKEFTWKVIGGVGTVLLIIATFAPHIHFN